MMVDNKLLVTEQNFPYFNRLEITVGQPRKGSGDYTPRYNKNVVDGGLFGRAESFVGAGDELTIGWGVSESFLLAYMDGGDFEEVPPALDSVVDGGLFLKGDGLPLTVLDGGDFGTQGYELTILGGEYAGVVPLGQLHEIVGEGSFDVHQD